MKGITEWKVMSLFAGTCEEEGRAGGRNYEHVNGHPTFFSKEAKGECPVCQ